MKSFIFACIMSITIIISGYLSNERLKDVSDEFIRINDRIKDDIDNRNFLKAVEKIELLEYRVSDNEKFLLIFTDHTAIFNIKTNISQMKSYVLENKKEDSLSYSCVLNTLFEHLPENYKLSVENIL